MTFIAPTPMRPHSELIKRYVEDASTRIQVAEDDKWIDVPEDFRFADIDRNKVYRLVKTQTGPIVKHQWMYREIDGNGLFWVTRDRLAESELHSQFHAPEQYEIRKVPDTAEITTGDVTVVVFISQN